MTTTYDKKSIADYTLNFATSKAESKFSLDGFKRLFGGISNTDDITDPNFKKAIEYLVNAIPQSETPIEVSDDVNNKIELAKPQNQVFNNDDENNSSVEEDEEQEQEQEQESKIKPVTDDSGAVAAAIAVSNSSDRNGNDNIQEKPIPQNQVAVVKGPDVNVKVTAVDPNPLDVNNKKKKVDEEGDGQEDRQDAANTPEPPTKIDGGETVTYITPQKLVYIYNKKTGKTYEYEESLENKEDNLREVKLEENSENKFQVNIGDDKFETISESNIQDHYKFITKSNDITKYFYRDMLYSTAAVLKDIKESFFIK